MQSHIFKLAQIQVFQNFNNYRGTQDANFKMAEFAGTRPDFDLEICAPVVARATAIAATCS